MNVDLPDWADRDSDGVVLVDVDAVTPVYLRALGVDTPDQYWLQVVQRIVRNDLVDLLGTGLRIRRVNGENYRHADHPVGAGPARANAEFHRHHAKLSPLVDPARLFEDFKRAWRNNPAATNLPKHPIARGMCEPWLAAQGVNTRIV